MALMQRYLTHPDDPESEVDIAMQITISQAAVDSKGFEVLVPATVENVKRVNGVDNHAVVTIAISFSFEDNLTASNLRSVLAYVRYLTHSSY